MARNRINVHTHLAQLVQKLDLVNAVMGVRPDSQ